MDMKQHLVAALREEFDRWEELLAGLSEDEITTPLHTVLVSSYAHHHIEHLEHLRAWLREHGLTTIGG
jgi:hypothetical protein